MYGKSYEAKKILYKKPKRGFPKEVIKDVSASEDLFSALFSDNIKEIKQKVKLERNCSQAGCSKKVSRKPNISVLEEAQEISESGEIGDIFHSSGKSEKSPVDNKPKFFLKHCKSSENSSKRINEKKYFTRKHDSYSNKSKPNLDDSWFRFLDDDPFDEILKGASMQPYSSDQNCFGEYISGEKSDHGIPSEKDKRESVNLHCDLVCSTPAQNSKREVLCELSPVQVNAENHQNNPRNCSRNVLCHKENAVIENNLSDNELSDISNFDALFISSSRNCNENEDEDNLKLSSQDALEETESYEEKSDLNQENIEILDSSNFDPFASSLKHEESLSQISKQSCLEDSGRNEMQELSKPSPRNSFKLSSRESYRKMSPSLGKVFNSMVNDESQSPSSLCRFKLRKSHVVIPLESWNNCSKRSTGFRQAHIACTNIQATRLTISAELSLSVNEEVEQVFSFRDLVLQYCEQSDILDFAEEFPDSSLIKCAKVGEGVYGEVFARQLNDGCSTVLKIIPVEGCRKINGEIQKKFEEILSEIVITTELSNLRKGDISCTSNFPEMISCRCVQGPYPSRLLELWEMYDEEKTSENDSPDILPEDQIFIILELANVGSALEGYLFNSAEQSYSVFTQVTYALAVAETILEFEHRDLHWGNVLVQPTKEKKINYKLGGKEFNITTHGVKANVIDFTLSRMTFEGCCVFNNLSDDPEIFEGTGDYQFDIYRLMRDKTNDNWQIFEPYTNVLWLSYILDKLVTEVYYRNKTSKTHKRGMDKLQDIRGRILEFQNASAVALALNI